MRGAVAVNDADAYIACALAGLGLAKTSMYLMESHLRTGTVKDILQPFNAKPRPIPVLYAPNRHPPKKLKIFIDRLAALYAQNPVLQGKTL
jgi:LysR family transcriptional regulator for bpeEF and oprC